MRAVSYVEVSINFDFANEWENGARTMPRPPALDTAEASSA